MGQDVTFYIYHLTRDIRIAAIISSAILFVPATVLLGMVSPILAKLRINDHESSGSAIGNLYAISTLGSIVGTFLGGFLLISYLGTTRILYSVAVVLILTSFLALSCKKTRFDIARYFFGIFFVFILVDMSNSHNPSTADQRISVDIDTRYSRYKIYDSIQEKTGRPVRYLTNSMLILQSGMFLDAPQELLFEYTQSFDLVEHFFPDYKTALLIGAGGYSYPKHFIVKHPDRHMDVVDIDPNLEEISEKYLNYSKHPAVTSFFEDGRTFLNYNTKKYDVIFVDAYLSYFSIPFQLTTQEAVQHMSDGLSEHGVVAVNVVGAFDSDRSRLLRSIYATYRSVFPRVILIPIEQEVASHDVQNILLVAFKSGDTINMKSKNPTFQNYLNAAHSNYDSTGLVFTDEFSPVELFVEQMIR